MAGRSMSRNLAKQVCAGWASRTSIFIISIASIPKYPSKRPSAPWPNWYRRARFATSDSPKPAQKRCSPAQLALAWLLARGEDIVPIAGTKRRSYLEQNLGALQVKLTAADLSRLDRAAPPGAAAGARYPQEAMQRVNI